MTRTTKTKPPTTPTPTVTAIPPADVLGRLAALKTTTTPDLKRQWRELFAAEPPPYNRRFLETRLAYRVQELAYGGLKPETIQRLEELGEQLDGGNPVLRRIRGDDMPIVPRAMWDAAHALLTISPRTRANRTRCQTPSLLRGLIFGSDGRAMSPTHARGRRGQQYRYYVSQSVLKGSAADGPAIARISAAEIEGAVIAQVRGLLRQPEVVLGAWRAARAPAPDMTEDEARLALERLVPLWEELFPAEQARIIRLLVDRVDVGAGGADVRLKLEGLASLVRDLATPPPESARAAA